MVLHLLLNSSRLTDWNLIKTEVLDILRAQAAVHALPVEIGAFGENDKDGQCKYNKDSKNDPMKCFNSEKSGRVKKDCTAAGGGAANDSRKRGTPVSGSKGAGGTNGEAKGLRRWKCCGK